MHKIFECCICGQENTVNMIADLIGIKRLGAWCCNCGIVNEFSGKIQLGDQLPEKNDKDDDALICIPFKSENRHVMGLSKIGEITKWIDDHGNLLTREEFAVIYGIDPFYLHCMQRPKDLLCKEFENRCSGKTISPLLVLDGLGEDRTS
jgi:hypothetical protein